METKKFDLSNRLFVPALIIAIEIMICFVVFTYLGVNGAKGNNVPNEITVSGEGKAYVKPDIALVKLGLTNEAAKSEDAVSENNTKMNEIIKQVKALGIEEKDIVTTNYNLAPKYNYDNGKSSIDGYTLSQEINLKIRDFGKVGDVIKTATALGANTVNQVQFTLENPDQAKNEAMKQAIEKAKAKAETMSQSSGLKLGKIINVYEQGTSGVTTPQRAYSVSEKSLDASTGMGGSNVASPDIQSGEQEVTVNMSIVYRIN